jgi:hypothetical protein
MEKGEEEMNVRDKALLDILKEIKALRKDLKSKK